MSMDPLAAVKPGEFRMGIVTAVTPFGAFLDVGGVTGLARREELSWRPVADAREVVAVGDQVNVQILEVDLDGERMVLSAKAAQADPWQAFAHDHKVGDTVRGKVAELAGSVARVIVEGAIEGTARLGPEPAAGGASLADRQALLRIVELDPQLRHVAFLLVGLA